MSPGSLTGTFSKCPNPGMKGGDRATAGAVGPEFNRRGLFASPQIIIVTMKQMERVRQAAFEKLFSVNSVVHLLLKGEKQECEGLKCPNSL